MTISRPRRREKKLKKDGTKKKREQTGMSVSQVTDEVLFTGLVEMQELPEHEE